MLAFLLVSLYIRIYLNKQLCLFDELICDRAVINVF